MDKRQTMENIPVYETTPTDNPMDNYHQSPDTTHRLKIGGIFLIIAGLTAITGGILILAIDASDPLFSPTIQSIMQIGGVTHQQALDQVRTILTTCAVVEFILATFTILGGVVALQRKKKSIALIGGILGIFTFGPILFVSTIMSIIGLIFILTSKNEFQ